MTRGHDKETDGVFFSPSDLNHLAALSENFYFQISFFYTSFSDTTARFDGITKLNPILFLFTIKLELNWCLKKFFFLFAVIHLLSALRLCSDLGGSVREDDRPDRPDGQSEKRHHGPQHQRAPHAQEPGLPQEGLGDLSQEPGESPDYHPAGGSDSCPCSQSNVSVHLDKNPHPRVAIIH